MPCVFALDADKFSEINLKADSVEIDEDKGVSVYRGNVEFRQGSIRLSAGSLNVFHVLRQVEKIIATGEPVVFEQQINTSGDKVKAQANRIEYGLKTELIKLDGNAHLWRAEDELMGSHIVYDAIADIVQAHKDKKSGKGRVEVIIKPDGAVP